MIRSRASMAARAAVAAVPAILLLLQMRVEVADAHGRLIEPPSRSTMWR